MDVEPQAKPGSARPRATAAKGSLHFAVADVIAHIGRRLQNLSYAEGLNPAQWSLLRFLARSNPSARTSTGFARFNLTAKNAAAQTVDALLRKKLIRKGSHPHDQRAKLLELTAGGTQILQADPMNDLVAALARLPEEDLHHLARISSALAHDLYVTASRRVEPAAVESGGRDGTYIGD
jgi:DNA-binding MarR family transcriptional regulator